MRNGVVAWVLTVASLAVSVPVVGGQAPKPPGPSVQKLGATEYRIGQIQVDTAKREISVPGTANEVLVLEFVANTRDGMKAYESALTLDTDAVSFNTALLLIGLDRSRSRVPEQNFDPIAPAGDRVEMVVEWTRGTERVRVGAEQLLFDKESGQPAKGGPWVYTGSGFLPDGQYLAEVYGALIGFVHSPIPIIEQVGGVGVRRYGSIVTNPNLGLEPNTAVTLTIRAVDTGNR
jgi:hypothetical protein